MPRPSKVSILELNVKELQSENRKLSKQMIDKQLQINRLLNVTQAINNNAPAAELFRMYKEFLDWDLGVGRVALLLPRKRFPVGGEIEWHTVGTSDALEHVVLAQTLAPFEQVSDLPQGISDFFDGFDQIIPVKHKDSPIAYSLIGGLSRDSEWAAKVQWIMTITNVIAVAFENKRLFKRQLEQERLNHEIHLAGDMQRKLVPERLPQTASFEISQVYRPHLGIGGDYYDCFRYYRNRYLFCVADVSGKGLAAALVMSNFQAQLHTLVRKSLTVESFIADLNSAIVRVTETEKYITMFIAEYDCDTRRLRYLNAGHIPPILVRRKGRQVELLKKGCTILGFMPKLPKLEIGETYLDDETLLLMFTDGITETKNPEGIYFDEDLLYDFAKEYWELSPTAFNQQLMNHIERFRDSEPFPDDITVLTCKFASP